MLCLLNGPSCTFSLLAAKPSLLLLFSSEITSLPYSNSSSSSTIQMIFLSPPLLRSLSNLLLNSKKSFYEDVELEFLEGSLLGLLLLGLYFACYPTCLTHFLISNYFFFYWAKDLLILSFCQHLVSFIRSCSFAILFIILLIPFSCLGIH